MGNLSEKERMKLEAQFNAEKARLESEFNEKMLKSQREADPSASATSPAKEGSQAELSPPPKAVKLIPQGLAKVRAAPSSDAASVDEA